MEQSYFKDNLKLSKDRFTKSIFKLNSSYNEHTPLHLLQAFIANKQGVSLKGNRVLRKVYDNENTQMELYLKKFDKKEKVFKVKYNLPAHKWGRISPEKSLSLCVFHRPTRHAYCKGKYIDIDFKNAHPVIIYNICMLNGLPCPTIKKYCENREKYLQDICDHHRVERGDAKTLMLRMSYGGVYENWITEQELKQNRIFNPLPEILEYQTEMAYIRDKVFEKNTHIIADVEKADPQYFKNPKYKTPEEVLRKKKKTCMSHFCNTIERHLQEVCIKHLIDNKNFNIHDDVVPCQDGFMIRENLWYDGLINECETAANNLFKFKMELAVKEFDEACEIPIREIEDEENDEAEPEDIRQIIDEPIYNLICLSPINDTKITGLTEYDIAKVIHHYYKDNFVCSNIKDNIWYEFKDHRWICSDSGSTLRNIISEDFRNKFFELLTDLTPFKNNKKVKVYILKLREVVERLGKTLNKKNIMTECKEIFYKRNFEEELNTNVRLLCFTNGVFDSDTLTFREGKPEDMCSLCTNIELKALNDEEKEYMEDVKRRLFYEPLGYDVGDYFLLTLAQAIAGKRLKRINFGLGGTNRGKSTITTACTSALGDYVGSFNAENLAYRKSSQDEAQIMRWALLLRHKRVIFSNEMKSTVELNGNMIKKISSGGDRIIGRRHCEEETSFVCDFLAVCMSNDLNRIKPYDEAISKRVRIIPYEKEFVDEPENELQLKKDPNLEKEMQTDLFKQVFVSMLLFRYDTFIKDENGVEVEPTEVANAKQEWTGDDGGKYKFVDKFLEEYEITNNAADYTPSKTMEDWLNGVNLGISYILFTKELKAYCKIHNCNNVESKKKKVCGKTPQVWVGVKQISYNPEFDGED